MKCYILTLVDETDITRKIRTEVFTEEESGKAAFNMVKHDMEEAEETPGTNFIEDQYEGYISSYKNELGLLILRAATIH